MFFLIRRLAFISQVENTISKTLHVSRDVIAGIISNAVKEVEGVRGIAPLPKNPIQQWFKGDDFGDIRIGLVDDVLSVSVGIIINGGAKAVHTAEKVQNKIKSAVQGMLGITVAKVNVKVCDAVF